MVPYPITRASLAFSDISGILRNDGGTKLVLSSISLLNTFYYNDFAWNYVSIRLGSRRALWLIRLAVRALDRAGGDLRTNAEKHNSRFTLCRIGTGG